MSPSSPRSAVPCATPPTNNRKKNALPAACTCAPLRSAPGGVFLGWGSAGMRWGRAHGRASGPGAHVRPGMCCAPGDWLLHLHCRSLVQGTADVDRGVRCCKGQDRQVPTLALLYHVSVCKTVPAQQHYTGRRSVAQPQPSPARGASQHSRPHRTTLHCTTPHHRTPHEGTKQYDSTRHDTTRHDTTRHMRIGKNATQRSVVQNTAQHKKEQHSTAQQSTKYNTMQHNTAQHSTAEQSRAQHHNTNV